MQHLVHAVGIRVVEKEGPEPIGPGLPEGMGDELRAQRRAADPNHQQVAEGAGGARDLAGVNLLAESFDGRQRGLDFPPDLRRGSQRRRAQPIMADPPLFVRVGDGSLLERRHGGIGLLHPRLKLRKKIVRELDATHVHAQAQGRAFEVVFAEPLPELLFGRTR